MFNNIFWWMHDKLDPLFHKIAGNPDTWAHKTIRKICVWIVGERN